MGPLGLAAQPFQRGVVAVLDLLGGGQAGLHRGGLDCSQERRGDRVVDGDPADAQVQHAAALDELPRAGAGVAGRGLGGALVLIDIDGDQQRLVGETRTAATTFTGAVATSPAVVALGTD